MQVAGIGLLKAHQSGRELQMPSTLKLRQARSRDRYRAIVDAATKIFGRKGIDGSSLTEVAKLAKVPLSSIYDYFDNKEALVVAIPERNFEELYQLMDTEAVKAVSCNDRLRRLFLRTFRYIVDNPDWGRVFFLEIWPSVTAKRSEIRKSVDEYGQRYIEIIKEGVVSGEFAPRTDPYLTMSLLMGAMTHLVSVWLIYGKKFDLQAKAAEAYKSLSMGFCR